MLGTLNVNLKNMSSFSSKIHSKSLCYLSIPVTFSQSRAYEAADYLTLWLLWWTVRMISDLFQGPIIRMFSSTIHCIKCFTFKFYLDHIISLLNLFCSYTKILSLYSSSHYRGNHSSCPSTIRR